MLRVRDIGFSVFVVFWVPASQEHTSISHAISPASCPMVGPATEPSPVPVTPRAKSQALSVTRNRESVALPSTYCSSSSVSRIR